MSAHLTSTDGATWTTLTGSVTICGVAYTATVTRVACEGLCLTLTSPGGSPVTYPTQRVAVGKDWATFAVGHPGVCSGEPADCGRPSSNLALLRVEWACCAAIEGWAGPGWYCVRDAGSADPCEPVELLDEDRCDCAVEVCSGPYADEAAARAACPAPGLVAVSCSGVVGTVSRYFRAAVAGVTDGTCGDCEALNRTYVVGFDPAASASTCWWRDPTGIIDGSCAAAGCFFPPSLGSGVYLATLALGTTVVQFTISLTCGAAAQWSAPRGTWDGASALTLSLVAGASGRCATYPATVTITPVLP